eukprot:216227-Chlamydomonas_euryale.AAC.2
MNGVGGALHPWDRHKPQRCGLNRGRRGALHPPGPPAPSKFRSKFDRQTLHPTFMNWCTASGGR